MVVRQKWHVTRRNVKVEDIVPVQDSNSLKWVWKLAQVINANPGRDGMVRDVHLRYKLTKDGRRYDGSDVKHMSGFVHRLVVLLPTEEQL